MAYSGFPMQRTNDRMFSPNYAGPIDIWDIDKTYLESEFERLKDLVETALEQATDKRARPGVVELLRALRRGPHPEDPSHHRAPLYFVSASPPQLRRTLEQKMLIDGIEWDGIALKDSMALLRAGRFGELRRHVAYKLTALLEYRREWPKGAREWLYGDDAEADPLIYSLFADIRAGRLRGAPLDHALAKAKVSSRDRRYISELALAMEPGSVEAIFIFSAAKGPKRDLGRFPSVTRVADAVACAEHLAERGRIAEEAVLEIAQAVREA